MAQRERVALVLSKPLAVHLAGITIMLPVGLVVAIHEWPSEVVKMAQPVDGDDVRLVPAGSLKVGDMAEPT